MIWMSIRLVGILDLDGGWLWWVMINDFETRSLMISDIYT